MNAPTPSAVTTAPPSSMPTQKDPPGAPLQQFDSVSAAFAKLREQGRFAIFQGRSDSIRFIGEIDELVLFLKKDIGVGNIDSVKAKAVLEEIRAFIQISMIWTDDKRALMIFEESVFDDEFEAVGKESSTAVEFREILRKKLALVKPLISPAMLERSKRLSTAVGSNVLEDVDVELINRRNSPLEQVTVISPFLRLKFRYSNAARTSLYQPPWLPSQSEGRAFELECDETDIDLLVGRLLKAKELLSRAVEESVSPKEANIAK